MLGSWVRIPLSAWMSVCVVLCVGSGLAAGWSPLKGILPTVCKIQISELILNEHRPETVILQCRRRRSLINHGSAFDQHHLDFVRNETVNVRYLKGTVVQFCWKLGDFVSADRAGRVEYTLMSNQVSPINNEQVTLPVALCKIPAAHSIYLSIYLSICLSVCLSVCPPTYSSCSHLEHRASAKRFVSLQLLRQWVGLLGRGIIPKQGGYLHRTTQTQNKRTQISMTWVGFELTIPLFERAKTCHVLDRAATVMGIVHTRLVCCWSERNVY
jgi:hypothetical protein